MKKRNLSLLLTGLSVISGINANPGYLFNAKLGRYIDAGTGKIVSAKMVGPQMLIDSQEYLAKMASGLRPSSLVPFSGSAISNVAEAASKSYNSAYAFVGAGVASAMSAAEYILGKSESAVESIPVVVETVTQAVPAVVQPLGYMAQAQSFWNNFEHKKAVYGVTGLVAFATAMKLYDSYKANPATPVVEQAVEQVKNLSEVDQTVPVVAKTEPAPKVETPAVKIAEVKLTIEQIAQKNALNPHDIIGALKAHGYTKVQVSESAASLRNAGKLNDGQVRFVIANIR